LFALHFRIFFVIAGPAIAWLALARLLPQLRF